METKVKEKPQILKNRLCESCKQPMTEIAFNTSVYACFCDNDKCEAFHRPFYSRDRDNNGHNQAKILRLSSIYRNRKEAPGYQAWLIRKREAYAYAKGWGFTAKRAARLASCSFAEIARIAEEELGRLEVVTSQ